MAGRGHFPSIDSCDKIRLASDFENVGCGFLVIVVTAFPAFSPWGAYEGRRFFPILLPSLASFYRLRGERSVDIRRAYEVYQAHGGDAADGKSCEYNDKTRLPRGCSARLLTDRPNHSIMLALGDNGNTNDKRARQ